MSVAELVTRMKSVQVGGDIDWRVLRKEIHDEASKPISEVEHEILLGLFRALMDNVGRTVEREAPDKLAEFQKTVRQDYCLLIIRQATAPDGNVITDKLHRITAREVAAGRMAADDELHKLAVYGDEVLTPNPRKLGFFSRLFGRG